MFEQEIELLKDNHNVMSVSFYNKKGIVGALQFFFSLWNISVYKRVKSDFLKFKPDVVHIHNWHYASGPIIIQAAKKRGIPVVVTIHNYRLLCPSGSLMNDGKVFLDSTYVRFPWSAVFRKVFRNSYLMTFWLGFIVWFHKKIGTWNLVDRYIVLTDFVKHLYVSSSLGIDSFKYSVKPNFVNRFQPKDVERQSHYLYIGRLSKEKGAEIMLSAFQGSKHRIRIAGEGTLTDMVRESSKKFVNIEYLGVLDREDIRREIQECTALLFPSIWYEPFGMVLIEAFALGCPVIASNIGSPTELVKDGRDGMHFEAGNCKALSDTLDKWASLPEDEKQAYGNRARSTYEQYYTPEVNYEMLMNIYQSVLGQKSVR